ncbi:hypothetical protein [Apilactobacillus apinorum]|uniref:hypothetical protein n=1 Tax=Apilactobacillus apinorum TaxID=1218495 RepID=UPI0006B59B0D|nr:hypothetical protein [Apilactobacillus apinorum]KOY68063.1 hypothetical protein RZ74_12990 [Apilactobacillus apinorum]CAI2695488.1 Hypothetical protein AAPFHON13_14050 [Apilactobacillus apinorum]
MSDIQLRPIINQWAQDFSEEIVDLQSVHEQLSDEQFDNFMQQVKDLELLTNTETYKIIYDAAKNDLNLNHIDDLANRINQLQRLIEICGEYSDQPKYILFANMFENAGLATDDTFARLTYAELALQDFK